MVADGTRVQEKHSVPIPIANNSTQTNNEATAAGHPQNSTLSSFAQTYKEAKLGLIINALKEPFQKSEGISAIAVLDDEIVTPLNLHATLLKDLSYPKWYRLSTVTDTRDAINAAYNSSVQSTSESAVNNCDALTSSLLLALTQTGEAHDKRQIKTYINFIPERRYSAVTSIFDALKHLREPSSQVSKGPFATPDSSSLPANDTANLLGVEYGRLILFIRDLPVRCYPIDRQVFTMRQIGTHKRIAVEGDLSYIENVHKTILDLVRMCEKPSDGLTILALGQDATYVGKRLHSVLRNEWSASTPFSNAEFSATRPNDVFPLHQIEQGDKQILDIDRMHKFADSILLKGFDEVSKEYNIDVTRFPAALKSHSLTKAIHQLLINTESNDQEQLKKFIESEIEFTRIRSPYSNHVEDKLLERIRDPQFSARFPCILEEENVTDTPAYTVKSITLVDRAIDWISPFVAPFTYEAFLDLAWTVDTACVAIPHNVRDQQYQQPVDERAGSNGNFKLTLSHQDRIYTITRDLPHTKLGAVLHACAVQMQMTYQRDKSTSDWSVAKMQSFISQLKQQQGDHRDLTEHTHLISYLANKIIKSPSFYVLMRVEDDIMSGNTSFDQIIDILRGLCQRQAPIHDIYRLAIMNIRMNGDSHDRAKMLTLKRTLIRQYGLWEARRWELLEQAGIMRVQSACEGELSWSFLRNLVQEITSEITKECEEKNLAFVHSGYIPVSAGIVQCLFEARRPFVSAIMKQSKANNVLSTRIEPPKPQMLTGNTRPLHLVVFATGATWSEVCAIRHIAKLFPPEKGSLISQYNEDRPNVNRDEYEYEVSRPYAELLGNCLV